MAKSSQYRLLVTGAFVLGAIVIAWSLYDGALRQTIPGEHDYHSANKYFEDGHYDKAKLSYLACLSVNPDFIHAKRGLARSLMQLDMYEDSLVIFDEVIQKDPEFAASYANRGILYDRLGRYENAIKDYKKAIELDKKIVEGPSWITRFLRNQIERPPNVHDRLIYLQNELLKTQDEQLLNVPELDELQQPYKS
ncbi:MAG: tetratricopeptide repeat protein [Gammaproteobacteria bacterium]|nr:tetratricopeptide repeat protein [Gammaproteobacteria bacterium]